MNYSQHISSSCTNFFYVFSATKRAAIIGDISVKGKTGDRSSAVGSDSLELGRGVLIGQQIGTDGREAGPRLDRTREKKVHAQASCLWSGKVAGTRTVCVRRSLRGQCVLHHHSRAVGGNPKKIVTLCGIDSGCNALTTAPFAFVTVVCTHGDQSPSL
jgi:hypothetical protein